MLTLLVRVVNFRPSSDRWSNCYRMSVVLDLTDRRFDTNSIKASFGKGGRVAVALMIDIERIQVPKYEKLGNTNLNHHGVDRGCGGEQIHD